MCDWHWSFLRVTVGIYCPHGPVSYSTTRSRFPYLYSTREKPALGPCDEEIIKEPRAPIRQGSPWPGALEEHPIKEPDAPRIPQWSTPHLHRYDGPHDRRHAPRSPGIPAASLRDRLVQEQEHPTRICRQGCHPENSVGESTRLVKVSNIISDVRLTMDLLKRNFYCNFLCTYSIVWINQINYFKSYFLYQFF